jgi:hypothetical protein
VKLESLVHLDRRIIYLLIAIGTILPVLLPIGFRVTTTAPVEAMFDKIESLGPEDVVMISFDYGPTTAPENTPMALATLRHCFTRNVKVVALALFPIGGITMAGEALATVAAEFPEQRYGRDYVLLGYKDGAQAAMKQMGVSIANVFPRDNRGTPLDELPLMQRVHNFADVDLVVSFATNIIGDYWANLVNAQYNVPVAIGCTAVSAPKFYAFYDAHQIMGLLGGLKGASEYEKLVAERYERLRPVYSQTGVYNAMRGMDAQTVDHAIIMAFILFGNVVYFLILRRDRRLGRRSA